MNIWRLKTHHEEPARALAWTKQHNRIAIGWGKIGDLGLLNHGSKEEIATAIRAAYPDLGNSGDGGPSLWRFFSELEAGDLVILSGEVAREFVVEIVGDYEWREDCPLEDGEYNHQRRIQKRYLNPDKLWHLAGGKVMLGQNSRGTLLRLARPVTNHDLNEAGL